VRSRARCRVRRNRVLCRDTRLVSGYRLKLGGKRPILLNGAAPWHHSARFEFTNPAVVSSDGDQIPNTRSTCASINDRSGVHEDYDLTNQGRDDVVLDLEVSIESDFADLFDVKAHRRVRRGSIRSFWDEGKGRLQHPLRQWQVQPLACPRSDEHDSPPEFRQRRHPVFESSSPRPASWHCLCVVDAGDRQRGSVG